ncbi:MAG: hypothetical protein K8R21_15365 [Leptospira sp.]|nr:hypothetical protein [Leptospira sp.]
MYPLNLESDYEKLWQKEFSKIFADINRKIYARLKDTLADNAITLGDIAIKNQRSGDSDGFHPEKVAKFDDSALIKYLQDLQQQFGPTISSENFQKKIQKNLFLVNAWARDKTTESIRAQYVKMKSPPMAGQLQPNHPIYRVPAIPLPDNAPQVLENINKTMMRQADLSKSLFAEHMKNIQAVVSESLRKGESTKTIAEKLQRATGVSESKAKFWAKDQVSKFFGEQTKINQAAAGIPGYIWRTMKDARVRDAHRGKAYGGPADQYWDWKNPPAIHRKGQGIAHLHPGDDYNCRCWAEPAFGPEQDLSQKKNPATPTSASGTKTSAKGMSPAEKAKLAQDLSKLHLQFQNVPTASVTGQIISPIIKPSGKMKTLLKNLQDMTKTQRVQMVHTVSSSEWDKHNLEAHKIPEREKQFEELFGANMQSVVDFILKNKKWDKIYVNERGGITVTFFYSGKRVVVPVSRESLKIKSGFILDGDVTEEYYFRNHIQIK